MSGRSRVVDLEHSVEDAILFQGVHSLPVAVLFQWSSSLSAARRDLDTPYQIKEKGGPKAAPFGNFQLSCENRG